MAQGSRLLSNGGEKSRARRSRNFSCTMALLTPTAISTSVTRSTKFSKTSSSSTRTWRASRRRMFRAGTAMGFRSSWVSRSSFSIRSETRRPFRSSSFGHLCRDYANKYIGIQKEQFQRLEVFGDWDHPYATMNQRIRRLDRSRARPLREERISLQRQQARLLVRARRDRARRG